MSNFVIPELTTDFLFRKRPVPIPADLRPGWRIGVILLMLRKCCRQGRTSFARLHVLNWGIRTEENRQALLRAVAGTTTPGSLLVRIEPSLNRAVDFAIGEELLRRVAGDKVELIEKGILVADEIDDRQGIFLSEKGFMNSLGKKLTESIVNQMFR